MIVEDYKASKPLTTKLEQDHYNHARSFFRARGATEKNLDLAENTFKEYDKMKQDVIDKMKAAGEDTSEYVKYSKGMSGARAIELIQLAFEDHCNHVNEPVKTSQWRRA